jgi:hypothetical protein
MSPSHKCCALDGFGVCCRTQSLGISLSKAVLDEDITGAVSAVLYHDVRVKLPRSPRQASPKSSSGHDAGSAANQSGSGGGQTGGATPPARVSHSRRPAAKAAMVEDGGSASPHGRQSMDCSEDEPGGQG